MISQLLIVTVKLGSCRGADEIQSQPDKIICKLNFLQNQKSQILKLEADALELNPSCWCTSRDTLEIITTFASDNYRRIYNDSTNLQIQPEKRYLQNQTKQ
ncbi:Hypothetical_protein [Hexamita inflata]|uniref:Hypothetical_protein n=1 Tax=Hexamita inflata TaxID=28002 RepID=A0AA86TU18_9EUKA|nr:Hypothetical protein HINF_LOCUS14627 [Hexamita inflata]